MVKSNVTFARILSVIFGCALFILLSVFLLLSLGVNALPSGDVMVTLFIIILGSAWGLSLTKASLVLGSPFGVGKLEIQKRELVTKAYTYSYGVLCIIAALVLLIVTFSNWGKDLIEFPDFTVFKGIDKSHFIIMMICGLFCLISLPTAVLSFLLPIGERETQK